MDLSKLLELLKANGMELAPESGMDEICSALSAKFQAGAKTVDEMTTATAALATANAELATLKKEKTDAAIAAAHSFVDETIKAGRITKESRDEWLKRATEDLAGTRTLVASFAAPAKEAPPSQITLTASYGGANPARKAELAKLIQTEADATKRAAYFSEWNSLN